MTPYGAGLTSRAKGLARRGAAALAVGVLLTAGIAAAEEWHEAYHSGLTALARGDHARAVEALRRSVAMRPEPGRNVITYGTNLEPRYFPYLHLAEAYLGLGQLDAARAALTTSSTWNREPADERQKLLARLEAAVEQRRPSPPPAAPVGTAAAPTPAPTVAATPDATATPAPTPAAAGPPVSRIVTASPALRSRPAATPAPAPRAQASPAPSPSATPSVAPPVGALEIVSQPTAASVYLDDELVGSTDPQTGRLVKSGLAPGRHRVRVSGNDHQDASRDIDIVAGGSAAFYATLAPVTDASPGTKASFIAFAVVAIALIAVLAWIALRRPGSRPSPIFEANVRSKPSSGRVTPTGHANPGARLDDEGLEWFGDFRLLGMLGRGGMASVYKAERKAELAALKRPLASFLDDPEFLQRFLREAEIGRALNHPNIVRILERGDVEQIPYFTMELLPGETLQAFVRKNGAVEPRVATSIVVQVAEALDFAHSKGVIHRDLKPSNIMLLGETVKVMDFGIARARRYEGLTATGVFLGTPEYAAPETIEGQGSDPRSDLYALGVVFFELLTGERPFYGDSPFAVLKKQGTEEPPPPSHRKAGVPPALDAIVLRLLRKAPDDRHPSAEDLVVALRDWLNRAA